MVLGQSAFDYTYWGDADIMDLTPNQRPIHHHDKSFIAEVLHLDKPKDTRELVENTGEVLRQRGTSSTTATIGGLTGIPSKVVGQQTIRKAKIDTKVQVGTPEEGSDGSVHFKKDEPLEEKQDDTKIAVTSEAQDLSGPAGL